MNQKLKYLMTLVSTTLLGNQTVVNAESTTNLPNDSFLGKLGISSGETEPSIFNFSPTNPNFIDENGGAAKITVNRTNCSSGSPPVSVSYVSGEGSATAGSDYMAVRGTLTWGAKPKGDCSPRTFEVPIMDDIDLEGNETVHLNLNTPLSGAVIGDGDAVLTIVDDEIVGNDGSIIDFSQANYHVDESEGVVNIQVNRTNCNNSMPLPASVLYHTTNASGDSTGSATAGRDYVGVNGVLSWGMTPTDNCGPRGFNIPLLDDVLVEGDETVNLRLSNEKGALLGQNHADLTLMDNDITSGAGALSFSQSHYEISESGQSATITVTRSECGPGSPAISVSYASRHGSATDHDYYPVRGTLTWETNDHGDCEPKSFQLPLKDDSKLEGNETIQLQLSNPTGDAIIRRDHAILTIRDNDFHDQLENPVAPDSSGIFSFSKADFQVEEGSQVAVISINRTACGSESPPASVTFTLTPGTATINSDYSDSSGILNWGMNDEGYFNGDCDPWYVFVPIINDTTFEKSETVNLRLSNPSVTPLCEESESTSDPAELGQRDAVLTIIDNDGSHIGFSETNYMVEENGQTAIITVNRSGEGCDGQPFPLPSASISYATSSQKPSTATSGSDYVAMTGILRWGDTASGNSCGSRQFEVPIIDDPNTEENETVKLHLKKSQGANNSQSEAILTLIDDDD